MPLTRVGKSRKSATIEVMTGKLSTTFSRQIKVGGFYIRFGFHALANLIRFKWEAAKQEAFEESIRLKNQFRTLDEDEVEFLDSVLESRRSKEEEARKELLEQLEVFRQKQSQDDRSGSPDPDNGPDTNGDAPSSTTDDAVIWKAAPRKRKRPREEQAPIATKLRKPSLEKPTSPPSLGTKSRVPDEHSVASIDGATHVGTATKKPADALGLGGYSSDDD